ncbi:hypothetical protein GCM10010121_100000 [Streptomyces brasiliensis]|uniref:Uncharacterized protein n=1 Tax=Streptomyces brasiliensis TaxID=1954 RepID=A0A917PEQ2_9ACTN|nr:hypothetical protein GCM10010121_100000 [Streptomyces brasiliensis]
MHGSLTLLINGVDPLALPGQQTSLSCRVSPLPEAAWNGEDGLTLRTWLSVTASGMRHRMTDHGLPPRAALRTSDARRLNGTLRRLPGKLLSPVKRPVQDRPS